MPLQVFNDTDFALGLRAGKVNPPSHSLTVIVKGTFRLTPGGVAASVPEDERALLSGDVYRDDERANSLVYDSDYALYKPRADVLVLGTCYAPKGTMVRASHAAITVGKLKKTIAVVGDRRWAGDAPSEPKPFQSIPLIWERSFGGEGFTKNPIGRGRALLPNLETPGALITSPADAPDPAGFGPIDRRWADRTARLGTYDEAWLASRWPDLPDDFDWGTFNAAPKDQQVIGYLRGDEPLAFENMHPEHALYSSRLPGARVRAFARVEAKGGLELREVKLQLDTLWVNMDMESLILVWRGSTPTLSREHEEIRDLLVVREDLAEQPLPGARYREAQYWQTPERPTFAAEKLQPSEEAGRRDAPPEGDVQAAMTAAMNETRAMLEKANVPKDMLDKLRSAATPDAFVAVLMGELAHDPEAAERVEREARERTKKLLADHGYDPSVLDDPDDLKPSPDPAWTRETVRAKAAAGESLAGKPLAGLDLSELDLRGCDLQGADLSNARLRFTKLDGARLIKAKLVRADVTGASMRGAIAIEAELFGADLSGVDLVKANLAGAGLRGATLRGAALDGADLSGAVLAQANGERASIVGASLTAADLSDASLDNITARGARLRGARLTGASLKGGALDAIDLTRADLSGASLDRASLREASLFGARCDDASFLGADLTGIRAPDGASFARASLRGARAPDGIFTGASLKGADLRGAELDRADLSGADLEGANLHRASLKKANLAGAKLTNALVTSANLFQCSLEAANLARADLRGSNLYGAELYEAKLAGAKLEGANLKATKLAPRGDA